MHDKNVSPVGWYFGAYLLRFVELDDAHRSDPEARFLSWENAVLVRASSLDTAFAKVERIGKQCAKPYRGGAKGIRVQWEYLGITELVPIYEELADGSEIAWTERQPRKLNNLRQLVRKKEAFNQ